MRAAIPTARLRGTSCAQFQHRLVEIGRDQLRRRRQRITQLPRHDPGATRDLQDRRIRPGPPARQSSNLVSSSGDNFFYSRFDFRQALAERQL